MNESIPAAVAQRAFHAWRRYVDFEPATPGDDDTERALLDAAVDAVAVALADLDPASPEVPDLLYWSGCAHVDRYLRTGPAGTDLDAAIDAFARLTRRDDVEPEGALLVRWRLAILYWERYSHHSRPDDLDRLVDAARAVLADPGAEALDTAERADLAEKLGLALAQRWETCHDPAVLDEAVDRLESALAAFATPDDRAGRASPAVLGWLYHERAAAAAVAGDRDAARAAIGPAVRWLDEAAGAIDGDDPRRASLLFERVWARWTRYLLHRDPTALPELDRVATEAVDSVPADDAMRESLRDLRWLVQAERAAKGQITLPAEVLSGVGSMLARGRQALARSTGRSARQALLLDEAIGRVPAAVKDFQAVPADDPGRPMRAGWLAMLEMLAHQRGGWDLDAPRLVEMLTAAAGVNPADPDLQASLASVLGSVQTIGSAGEGAGYAAAGLETLRRARTMPGVSGELAAEIDALIAGALMARYQHTGDVADLNAAIDHNATAARNPDLAPHHRLTVRAQRATAEARRAFTLRDADGLDRAIADLAACVDEVAEGDPRRGLLTASLMQARSQRLALRDFDDIDPAVFGEILDGGPRGGDGLAPAERAQVLLNRALVQVHRAIAARDVGAALDEGIATLREAIGMLDGRDDRRLRGLAALGSAYCMRAQIRRDPGAAAEAAVLLEQARDLAAHPSHGTWSSVSLALGRAYRMRNDRAAGDPARSRRAGLDGLRGQAWQVLLQSGTANAAQVARGAAEEAVEVANWCVSDDEPAQAAVALDAGRGLVLHAALSSTDVAAQLDAIGQPDLAARWRDHAGDGAEGRPDALRHKVLHALVEGGGGAGSRLLDPPGAAEVAATLCRIPAHALVYLLPGAGDVPPVAVVVPADGPPALVRLTPVLFEPELIDRFLGTQRARAARDIVVDGVDAAGSALRDLARWAWHGAMGDLMGFAARRGWSRPYRLVLVPVGVLGLVPWHAARGPDGRYVLEDAVVSYAASARLLGETVAAGKVPVTAGCLVVGDPTGDLAGAGAEAAAIRETVYRATDYLDRGTGTPDAVLGRLRGSARNPLGVLHLACHGHVVPERPIDSYLALAPGADGHDRLVAERLTAHAYGGGERWRLGTVVLAACSSSAAGRAYDEAFSLSTAFLVAGARSVVGSLWSVPDEATSVLMYMFHHNLVLRGLGPAEALREAQLWMLRPGRVPPPEMPAPLADRVRRVDGDDLLGWAGFTHLGQW